MLRIREIHFNHDTNSANSDALNIRQNLAGPVIRAPEWQPGYPSLPVAYARDLLGPTVNIRAGFSGGPQNGELRIRAVDSNARLPRRGGRVLRLVGSLFQSTHPAIGILGSVAERRVAFDALGNSAVVEFELTNTGLQDSSVGIYHSTWVWHYEEGGQWIEFDATDHKVYLILNNPRGPWKQDLTIGGGDNVHLPWIDALDLACTWASGADSKDMAAAMITRRLNTDRRFFYEGSGSYFGSCYFDLTSLLTHLAVSEGRDGSILVNCTDCANCVTTLSNLLGCDLFEGVICTTFIREHLPLGRDPQDDSSWNHKPFGYHEVAWLDAIGECQFVYDSSLQVDIHQGTEPSKHVPLLPVKLRYGSDCDGGPSYQHYLMSGPSVLEGISRRRELQCSQAVCDTSQQCGRDVKEKYSFSTWTRGPRAEPAFVVKGFNPWEDDCLGWERVLKEVFPCPKDVQLTRTLWLNPRNRDQRILISLYETPSTEQSQEQLAQLLGSSQLDLLPGPAGLGHVSFVNSEVAPSVIMWFRGNVCASVRQFGRVPVEAIEFAHRVDTRLTAETMSQACQADPRLCVDIPLGGDVRIVPLLAHPLIGDEYYKVISLGGSLFFVGNDLYCKSLDVGPIYIKAFLLTKRRKSYPIDVTIDRLLLK